MAAHGSQAYLVFYNVASWLAWAVLLALAAATAITAPAPRDSPPLHIHMGHTLRLVQSFAALEVLHSAIGLVRAPLLSTTAQVLSRLLVVWGAVPLLPSDSPVAKFVFPVLLCAWTAAELIRYSFYTCGLLDVHLQPLVWLRYSAFIVLYPLGVACEMLLLHVATPAAQDIAPLLAIAYRIILLLYPPGLFFLYSHMLAQRKKYIGVGPMKAPCKKA